MKKEEFLRDLKEHLVGIPKKDRDEILQDYEEHFVVGKKKKRSEEEIARSLGEPRIIARDIRKELSSENGGSLKDEAIETFVAGKKFVKNSFWDFKDKMNELSSDFQRGKHGNRGNFILGLIIIGAIILLASFSFRFLLVLIVIAALALFISKSDRERSKHDKKKDKELGEISIWKFLLVLAFNIFFFVGVWFSCFFIAVGGFIAGIALLLAGLLVLGFSVFAVIAYGNSVINDILYSALFAGLGIGILGVIFAILFEKLTVLFFKFTKAYLELNSKVVRK